MKPDKKKSGLKIKASLFVFFIIAVLILFRFTPLKEYLHPQSLKDFLAASGNLAPLLFILTYAVGICLFLPATLFTGIGAILFGTFFGFLYNITGAMLGASAAFFIGRYLGRDFAASLIGDRLTKYDKKIADNGFAVTLYLRLVFFPFTPMNFGMALTRVTFAQYFWGTFFLTQLSPGTALPGTANYCQVLHCLRRPTVEKIIRKVHCSALHCTT